MRSSKPGSSSFPAGTKRLPASLYRGSRALDAGSSMQNLTYRPMSTPHRYVLGVVLLCVAALMVGMMARAIDYKARSDAAVAVEAAAADEDYQPRSRFSLPAGPRQFPDQPLNGVSSASMPYPECVGSFVCLMPSRIEPRANATPKPDKPTRRRAPPASQGLCSGCTGGSLSSLQPPQNKELNCRGR